MLDVGHPACLPDPAGDLDHPGEKSVEDNATLVAHRSATMNPRSPVPAATSRMVSPGCGSSLSKSQSLTGAVSPISHSRRASHLDATSRHDARLSCLY